ncbi:kelch-like protein 34 [Ambystoma mexicanum]|uniref:kelch-like protein 34 n=1 Tax=Ambystoma mexicanum TaxID=8296 RepID=UPI0037E7CE06
MSYFLAFCKSHGSTVLSQYQSLRTEGLLCDVLLKVNGHEYPAHKSLLACTSDYFRAMFKDYTREYRAAVIHLKVVTPTGLQHILDFIYTSWLSLSMETLEDTLEAASYLQVPEALALCSRYIVNRLDLENCCFSANVASKFYRLDALSAAENFIITNLWRLLEFDLEATELLELNFRSLLAVVKSDRVPKINEQCLLRLVLKWLKYDKSRFVHIRELLEPIRFGLVPVEYLRKFYSNSAVPLSATTKSQIIKAIDYHTMVFKQPVMQDKYSTLRNPKLWIMLVGGETSNERLVGELLGFDVYNHKWRNVTKLPVHTTSHCICVVGNFLYVVGGESTEQALKDNKNTATLPSNKVYRYDPRFDRWVQTTGMLEPRSQFSCCTINNRIYAIAGKGPAESLHASVEVYDIDRDRWMKTKDLTFPVHGHACTVHQKTIYISGGKRAGQVNTSKDMYSFSVSQVQWNKQASMAIARFGHQMATVNDSIFTFLGMYEPFCDIEKYDPLQNQWTRLKPLIYDRFCYGLVVVEDTVLLIGGKKWQDSREVPTQNVVGYDTENDCWEEICPLPLPLFGTQCAVLQLSDLLGNELIPQK